MNNATNLTGIEDEMTAATEPVADAIGGDVPAGDFDLPGYDEWLAEVDARRAAEFDMDEAWAAEMEKGL